ncbi:MAG: DUF5329 family protein [Verrucomicrobiales bacterium]
MNFAKTVTALCVLLFSVALQAAPANVEATVKKVLKVVEQSEAKFIRNGKEYPAKDAAEHLQKKYDYYKKEIKTVDDFIEKCASKSIVSGKPYYIKPKNGKEVPFTTWLKEKVREVEDKEKQKPSSTP